MSDIQTKLEMLEHVTKMFIESLSNLRLAQNNERHLKHVQSQAEEEARAADNLGWGTTKSYENDIRQSMAVVEREISNHSSWTTSFWFVLKKLIDAPVEPDRDSQTRVVSNLKYHLNIVNQRLIDSDAEIASQEAKFKVYSDAGRNVSTLHGEIVKARVRREEMTVEKERWVRLIQYAESF